MKQYKQVDIDHILKVADASRYDEKELQQMLDLVIVNTLAVYSEGDLKIDYEDNEKIADYLTTITGHLVQSENNDFAIEVINKVNRYFELSSNIVALDREQGIIVGDYDRNIWRIVYALKTILLAEIEEKYNIPFTNENDLIEKLDPKEIDHFLTTYERIANNYIQTEANKAYLRFLSEYTGIDNFKPLIKKFNVGLDLIETLQVEAERLENIVLKKQKDDIERYKPMFKVPDLKTYKLNETDYKDIRDEFIGVSLNELLIRHKAVKNSFYKAIKGDVDD